MENGAPPGQFYHATFEAFLNGLVAVQGTTNNPQGPAQDQMLFAGHQAIPNSHNGTALPIRPSGRPKSKSSIGVSYQQGPQAQPGPQAQAGGAGQQIQDDDPQYLLRMQNNAVMALNQFHMTLLQQSGAQIPVIPHQLIFHNTQGLRAQPAPQSPQLPRLGDAHRTHQSVEAPQATSHSTAAPGTQTAGPSNHTSNPPSLQDSSLGDAGDSSDDGVTTTGEPPLPKEITQEIQARVHNLVKTRADSFKGYIKSNAEIALYEMAAWKAKRGVKKMEDKSEGYPPDHAAKMQLAERIFDAIQNMEGNQDVRTELGRFDTSLAVRTVVGLSDLETEILAYKLIEEMRKVQSGEPLLNLPAESPYKTVQEESFTVKVDRVVEALSVSSVLSQSKFQIDSSILAWKEKNKY
jgi:hypothetical protein